MGWPSPTVLAATWDPTLAEADPRTLALASFVLVRNHGSLLPLSERSLRRVAVLGREFPAIEAEHTDQLSRADLVLVFDPEQAQRAADANPRTVVVLEAEVPMPWLESVPAILVSWGGPDDALADVLLGRAEPGGRLPAPFGPFATGHGIGYTTWQRLADDRIANTGTRRGREVVQWWEGDRLLGSAVVEADPGEIVAVQRP